MYWKPTSQHTRTSSYNEYDVNYKSLTKKTWFSFKLHESDTLVDCKHEFKLTNDRKRKIDRVTGNSSSKKKKTVEMEAAKCMKIQVLPTIEQKDILRRWIGTSRWTYNQCVSYHKENPFCSIKELRLKFLNEEVLKGTEFEWALNVPYDVRDEGARDFMKAVESNKAKLKKDDKHKYEVRFRSKKMCNQETINILGKHTRWSPEDPSQLCFFMRSFPEPLKLVEPMPPECFEERTGKKGMVCIYDLRLTREKTGKWYLILPLPLSRKYTRTRSLKEMRTDKPESNRVIALDPGVRTFLTGYSPDGLLLEIGNGDIEKIHKVAEKIDTLQSACTKFKAKRKGRLKKRCHKLRKRIKNLVSEIHRKTAKLLCSEFDIIMIPKFQVSNMVKKKDRNISKRTVRRMIDWRHYSFRQLLFAKARETDGIHVIEVDESYTSKTCGSCGKINQALGPNKTFICPFCGFKIDRDANAARNIFIKNIPLIKQ